LLLIYVLVDKLGGSAAMGILAFAVIVGNADALIKMVGFKSADEGIVELDEGVRTVHTQFSFIIKSFFFTFIGLKLTPPWSLLVAGVVIGFGLLVARVPAVMAIARGEFDHKDRQLITVSLPRGMAAGVLATLPAQAGIAGTENLPSLVFAAVVTSIGLFAIGFRKIRAAQPSLVSPGETSLPETAVDTSAAPMELPEHATPLPTPPSPGQGGDGWSETTAPQPAPLPPVPAGAATPFPAQPGVPQAAAPQGTPPQSGVPSAAAQRVAPQPTPTQPAPGAPRPAPAPQAHAPARQAHSPAAPPTPGTPDTDT